MKARCFRWSILVAVSCLLLVADADADADADETTPASVHYFEKHVRPILAERCLKCHSKSSKQVGGNLLLDSRRGWQKGGDLGPAISTGQPDQSLLIRAIRYDSDELQMPPDGKLSDYEISVLANWIQQGAHDPRTGEGPAAHSTIDLEAGREFWAFQSPHGKKIPIPKTNNHRWPNNEIDQFVLAKLEQMQLQPAPPADKHTWLRRVTFDLTGLPPTPGEVLDFLGDDARDAYQKVVARLLASPQYGERWGRHWLDVARYADSNGLDENIAHGNAWRYRDYVIRSFNRDKPYHVFVKEQIAGDLWPNDGHQDFSHDRVIATGFLSLGPKVLAEVDETKMEMDIIDEQVETVGRAFMALTMGCARCHDHKFDPIRTEDYYALAGIFKSTKTMEHFTKIARWHEVPVANEQQQSAHADHLAKVEDQKNLIADFVKSEKERSGKSKETKFAEDAKARLAELKGQLKTLEESTPVLPTAMSVVDYEKPVDLRIHIRGNHLTRGDVVQRGVPVVFALNASGFGDANSSGRWQLANWLVDGRHPLVARVMVNRIWRWHFGAGLVESTDNFGQLGKRPINQPLLDWLANRFVNDGWSLKSLHRLIVLSSTYQMASQGEAAHNSMDPQNRFQWRANVRRLEAESIRDAILSVSGQLDRTMGGSLLHVGNREFLFDHTSNDKTNYDSRRRSTYLPIIRNHLYDVFQLFDYADASVPNSNRSTTTVAPQALFMMNSDFVTLAAESLANRLLKDQHLDASDRMNRAYLHAFGRMPTRSEQSRMNDFLMGQVKSGTSPEMVWTMLCQTLLMSNEFIYIR